jgi:hypothetical protein
MFIQCGLKSYKANLWKLVYVDEFIRRVVMVSSTEESGFLSFIFHLNPPAGTEIPSSCLPCTAWHELLCGFRQPYKNAISVLKIHHATRIFAYKHPVFPSETAKGIPNEPKINASFYVGFSAAFYKF